MLPFVRMLEYGNVVKKVSIVDIQVSRSHCLVLDSEGNLWGRGTNINNVLNSTGLSNTGTFILVQTGVSKMFCGYAMTLYVKDAKLYRLGSTTSWDAGAKTDPFEVPITFDASLIKKIQCISNTSIAVLMNDGSLYFKGAGTNGRFGNGSAGVLSAWTLSTKTDIKDMYHTFVSSEGSSGYTILLLNDGTVWGAGSVRANGTGFGFGTYLSTLSWIQRTATASVKGIAAGSGASLMILDSTDTLYGDGNLNGELDGDLNRPTYNNKLIASDVKLFGLNYESSYYVLNSTPTVLSSCGRNTNRTSSFTNTGQFVPRTDTDVQVPISAIYTPSTDQGMALQYVYLTDKTVVMGGNSASYQLGVGTGSMNLVIAGLNGIA